MRALRGRGRKKKAAKKKVVRRRRAPGRKMIGGIAYEPVKARKSRSKKKATKKRRKRAGQLPYGYGY